VGKYFITDDPRRGLALREKLRKSIRKARSRAKRKQDPKQQFHKYESLAATADKYAVTEKQMNDFCYYNGVHVRTENGVEVVDKTELDTLLERVGIKPEDTAADIRDEQKMFFTKTVNIR
jgi:hypothetical protein